MTDLIQNHLHLALQKGYIAAYRWLGNADESHEACQEAVTKAWAARGTYDTSKPFYPWFYRILKNHCFDRLRKKKKISSLDDYECVEPSESVETQLVGFERSYAVQNAILTLSSEHCEVIEWRHFQDLNYEEMALLAGVPVGTIMSRLYRARKALRLALLETPEFSFSSLSTATEEN